MCSSDLIDDDPVMSGSRFLNPGNQLPFYIRLASIDRNIQALGRLGKSCIDLIQRGCAVNRLFPGSEKIEIGAMEHKDPNHIRSALPPKSRA